MDVVFAKSTASVPLAQGGMVLVRGGSHWPVDDAVVRAHPDLFTTDPRYGLSYSTPPKELAEPPVETASATPGEKRTVRR